MEYSREVVEKVKGEFEQKRLEAVKKAEARQQEMFLQSPILKKIDLSLRQTGLKIFKAAIDGKNGFEQKIDELEKENQELQDEVKRILEYFGKPKDYLDIKYYSSSATGSISVKAEKNGQPYNYKGFNPYIFEEYGTSRVTISAKYDDGNGSTDVPSDTVVTFTIVNVK